MDLTNMIIELKVSNAYSKGGIPLAVEGVANIKIAGNEPTIHNAIERLLGKSRAEIEKMARFSQRDVERLLKNEGIVRHRGKIEAEPTFR